MAHSRLCSIPNCGKPHLARGWCSRHYGIWIRHGSPFAAGWTEWGEPDRFFLEVVLRYEGNECLDWPYARNSKGYAMLYSDGKTRPASRVICEKVHGPAPTPDHEAAHSCGRGKLGCVTKRHLRWATHAENESDKVGHSTKAWGEKHGAAKLTAAEVLEIRSLAGTLKQREIGLRYGIHSNTVSQIIRRVTWGGL